MTCSCNPCFIVSVLYERVLLVISKENLANESASESWLYITLICALFCRRNKNVINFRLIDAVSLNIIVVCKMCSTKIQLG